MMANPLRNEEEIYRKIKEENLFIHPLVWNLIDHHLRNDLQLISLAMGSLYSLPHWILKFASFMIKFLYKMSLLPGEADDLFFICNESIKKVKEIDRFLDNLKEATCGEGFK